MKEITLDDLQKIGKYFKGSRSMTEKEIAAFRIVPEGSTVFPDYESFSAACKLLTEKGAHYQAGGNHPEIGSFWIK